MQLLKKRLPTSAERDCQGGGSLVEEVESDLKEVVGRLMEMPTTGSAVHHTF